MHRIVKYGILAHCTLFLEDYERYLIPTVWNWMAFSWILPGWCREMHVSLQHKGSIY